MASAVTARPVVYSASSINSYQSCQLQWFRTYVMNDVGTPRVKTAIGIAVHEGAEHLLRAKVAGTLFDVDEAGDAYTKAEAAMRDSLTNELLGARTDDAIDVAEAFASASLCLATYCADVLHLIEPVIIEEPFQVAIDGIPLSGIIDVGDAAVRDLKTVGSRPGNADHYRFQLTLYALGYEQLTGRRPANRLVDAIVRTKHPYYWPLELGPIDDDDIDWLAARVHEVANGVAEERFRPTGLEKRGTCTGCQFRETCIPYINLQAIEAEVSA